MTRIALIALLVLPLAGGEVAVLRTGARMAADRIERGESVWVLYSGQGRIEIDPALIESVEKTPEAPARDMEAGDSRNGGSRPGGRLADQGVRPTSVSWTTDPRLLVTQAALRYGIHPALVHSVASVESAYRPDAVSPKGAVGVMQLMPGTAQTLSVDPNDVEQNIEAGARLLRELLEKYQNGPNPVRRALAAYNAGEGAVEKYRGVPPYWETQRYVEKVLERYWKQVDPGIVSGGSSQ